jgi:hypothetical protein
MEPEILLYFSEERGIGLYFGQFRNEPNGLGVGIAQSV